MNLLRGSHRVPQFSWLLLGLGLYSYRVRELLICWLFFIGMLAALGVVITGAAIAWYGGKCALNWASPLVQVAPAVLPNPVELRLESVPGSRRWK